MVEVVPAILFISISPLQDRPRLMLSQYALLEFDVVVLAGVSLVVRDQHRVQFLWTVFLGLEDIRGDYTDR